MITNSKLTIYHKEFDVENRIEKWIRFNYSEVWFFGGHGAGIDKGYENANDVQIRIPYDLYEDLNIDDFKIGDIIVKGDLNLDINVQQDIPKTYDVYNITSINNNDFGMNPHIHLGGK